jgi:hypothetical protein
MPDRRLTVFPRIATPSSLKNIHRNSSRRTFGVAAATVGVCAAVTSGIAAGGPAGTAAAATALSHVPAGNVAAGPPGGAIGIAGSPLVLTHARHTRTAGVRRASANGAHARKVQHRAGAHQHGAKAHHHAGPHHHGAKRHHAAHASPCHSSVLHWWICHAEKVLKEHGIPQSAIDSDAAFIVVLHESGGNPHAYNGWDSNAAADTPSKGIAQVIGPTFSSYALPATATSGTRSTT